MAPPELLDAVVATMLPGDGDWPSAEGLAGETLRLAALAPDGAVAVERLLTALPDGFPALAAEERKAALAAAEEADPAAFGRLLQAAYNAYYTDGRVLDVVEAKTGYPARAPQPDGYPLEPFQESLLASVRSRGGGWREA